MTTPAARPPWRVPRSRIDEGYVPSIAPPPTDKVTGIVASVDVDTCSVLIADEELDGVVIQGRIPELGEVVEIERRGDLWVLVNFPAEFPEVPGISEEAWHVVSDEDPGPVPPDDLEASEWPLGAVWGNPAVNITTLGFSQTAQGSSSFTNIASGDTPNNTTGQNYVEYEAQGPGVLVVIGTIHLKSAGVSSGAYAQITVTKSSGDVGSSGSQQGHVEDGSSATVTSWAYVTFTGPGKATLRWQVKHRFAGHSGGSYRVARMFGVWLPNAASMIVGDGVPWPVTPVKYWDGTAWTPTDDQQNGRWESKADATAEIVDTPTAVACSRSPGSVKSGETVTVTCTMTAPASGKPTAGNYEVQFNGSGSWKTLGKVKIGSDGSRTATFKHQPGQAGSYRCRYDGNASGYAASPWSSQTSAVTVLTKKSKSATVNVGWSQVYAGDGSSGTPGSAYNAGVGQGYYSGTHGNVKSLLRFAVPAELSGSDVTVTRVRLACKSWSHWFNNSGGDLVIGWHKDTSKPDSWGAATKTPDQSRHSVSTGDWTVNLTGWAATKVTRSDWGGITLGPGPTNSTAFYGYKSSVSAGSNDFQLLIDYEIWE